MEKKNIKEENGGVKKIKNKFDNPPVSDRWSADNRKKKIALAPIEERGEKKCQKKKMK